MARADYTVTVDDTEVRRALDAFQSSSKLPRTILVAFRESTLRQVRDVTKDKMRGQYLGRKTGTGIRSVTASRFDEISESEVIAGYGSHLDYIRAHEMGFEGTVHVRAHTRRLIRATGVSKRKAARAKKRLKRGHKRSTMVRAHGRRVSIQAKHFFRDTLSESRLGVGVLGIRALRLLALHGRVPKVAEVRG